MSARLCNAIQRHLDTVEFWKEQLLLSGNEQAFIDAVSASAAELEVALALEFTTKVAA